MNAVGDKQRKALGKGLSALLPARAPSPPPKQQPSEQKAASLPIAEIEPNPDQPRTIFQRDRLEELATSIRANGIIQPLIVRRSGTGYQIVAGERRWRAAQLAGLTEVPVVVQDVADTNLLELALIENLQREDLNPLEIAHAYDRLHREMGLSHEEIARRTGKDRTSVVNTIRLLKLPQDVQNLLVAQRISMGHARAILGLATAESQIEVAEKAAAQGMSVRQVEALVQNLTAERPTKGRAKSTTQQDPNVKAAADQLERVLGTRVRIVELTEQRGRIEIEYYSQAELDRIFQHISGENH
ncbi:MAG TPA: ParB/RepB/Spo0J family partition protein [Bryobacteraceae bacterium]|jgi:ParB family chromosome partitioning protein|nr:ParB/RepB/Spo0J family partition protein [Bryobacteraceae bacterium]